MGLSTFQLKWIAIITMLIDHVGAVLLPYELGYRIIGRIAFPIFCFLIVEGFSHTRDVRRYMARLGVFALVSEIPYDLAFHGKAVSTEGQNVFFTLFLGVLMMYMLSMADGIFMKAAILFFVAVLAETLQTDYSGRGILLIFIYYSFRGKKAADLTLGAAWNFLYGWGMVQCFGTLATPFLACYNGKKGASMKYFFYVFYPAHLLLLHLIHSFMPAAY